MASEYEDIIATLQLIAPRKHSTSLAVFKQRNQINALLWRILRLAHTNPHIEDAPLPRENERDYPIEDDVVKWLEKFGS